MSLMAPHYANQASFTIAAKCAAHAGGAFSPHKVTAARLYFGKNLTDHTEVANADILRYLKRDATLVVRALRRAVVDQKARERMLKLPARDKSYLAMQEAL